MAAAVLAKSVMVTFSSTDVAFTQHNCSIFEMFTPQRWSIMATERSHFKPINELLKCLDRAVPLRAVEVKCDISDQFQETDFWTP